MPSVKQQPIRNTIAMFMSRRTKTPVATTMTMTVCPSSSSDDDESSVTSTFSANRDPLHKHTAITNTTTTTTTVTRTPTKKSVCFNEACNESYDNTQMCKEDTIDFWYSTVDLSTFKVENNDLAKAITSSERSIQDVDSYQRVIRRVYDACLKQPFECCEQDDDDESPSLLLLSPDDSIHLQKWLNCSMVRIGLERKSVRCIAKDSHFRRKDIYKMVLEIQEMMATTTSSSSSSSMEDKDDKAEFLCQSCQALSRPSRLFAHELAVAQAAAL